MRVVGTAAVAGTVLAGLLLVAASPLAAGSPARVRPRASRTGSWIALAPTAGTPASGTPAVWKSSKGEAWVLWLRQAGSAWTYEVAKLTAGGRLDGKPSDVFTGKHWGSLSNQPTLLGRGGKPLVVFDGQNGVSGLYNLGCVYGALSGTSPWALQSWSLSANCTNPVGGAAEDASGTLAAAWPGGWSTGHGVLYRVGTSPSIPASGTDGHIALPGPATAFKAGVASDTSGNGDFYVAWTRGFSNPVKGDGYYVRDVSTGGPVVKAPDTGTRSVDRMSGFGNVAIASRNTRKGVFMAYCSNGRTCSIDLWRVGSSKVRRVPHSSGGVNPAISAGPGGRIWVAWYDESTNKLSVTRSNRAVTRFGPVHRYATLCAEHGLIGLSSGSSSRLDVALQCINSTHLQNEDFATQVMAGLSLKPGHTTVSRTSAHRLRFTVTDAGDAVRGAAVSVAGHTARTNLHGVATITLQRGTKAGRYRVTARTNGYLSAHATVTVTG